MTSDNEKKARSTLSPGSVGELTGGTRPFRAVLRTRITPVPDSVAEISNYPRDPEDDFREGFVRILK